MRGRKERGGEEDDRGRRERASEKDGEGERGGGKRRMEGKEGDRMTDRKEGER